MIVTGIIAGAVSTAGDSPSPRLSGGIIAGVDQCGVGTGANVRRADEIVCGIAAGLAEKLERDAITGGGEVIPLVGYHCSRVFRHAGHPGSVHIKDAEAVIVLHLKVERSSARIRSFHPVALAADHGAISAEGCGVTRCLNRPCCRCPSVEIHSGR